MRHDLMVFAYDFPHFKGREILLRLCLEGYRVKYAILAPYKQLSRPATTFRDAPSYPETIQMRDLCDHLGVPYIIAEHDSEEAQDYIKKHPVSLGIIAGAQIISPTIISLFPDDGGIVNTHEAMLPWVRGLDVLKWSIVKDLPIANSIHFIDESVDQGRLIYIEKTELRKDDTMLDISQRFVMTKPAVLVRALQILEKTKKMDFPELSNHGGHYFKIMPPEMIPLVLKRFPAWLEKHVGPAEPIDPFTEPYATIGKTPLGQ